MPNVFTEVSGTGSVFGAEKPFLLVYKPGSGSYMEDRVRWNDGEGIPQLVTTPSSADGIKHLGIIQSSADMWSKTIKSTYEQMQLEGMKLVRKQVSVDQLCYVVNHVLIARVQYRTQLGTSLKVAKHFDFLEAHHRSCFTMTHKELGYTALKKPAQLSGFNEHFEF